MKKIFVCMVLALALLAANEPHVRSRVEKAAGSILRQQRTVLDEDVPLSFAAQLGGEAASDMLDVTLYYRFADTDMLGMEQAQLDIRREETLLNGAGRVLVRPSGTEALIRVMVEAKSLEIANNVAQKLVNSIKSLKY